MKLTKLCLILVFLLSSFLPARAADPIYLPLVSGGSSASPLIDPVNLPICDPVKMEKLDKNSPPDYTSKDGCRVQGVSMGFPTHLEDEVSAASPSDLLVPSRWAKHVLSCGSCTSSNGIIRMQANISSQKVVIPGSLWHNYFWGNTFGVFDTRQTATCQNGFVTYPSARVGIGLGRATGDVAIITDRRIYWELTDNGFCYASTDPYNASLVITGASAPKFEIYKAGVSGTGTLWTGRVWLGTWVYLFSNFYLPINGSANGVSGGQVISAISSDFSSITEFTNFVHKFEVMPADLNAYRSWHVYALPNRFSATSTTDAPFNVIDLVAGDQTSISSNINQ